MCKLSFLGGVERALLILSHFWSSDCTLVSLNTSLIPWCLLVSRSWPWFPEHMLVVLKLLLLLSNSWNL